MKESLANPLLVALSGGKVARIDWLFRSTETHEELVARYKAIEWASVADRYADQSEYTYLQTGAVNHLHLLQGVYSLDAQVLTGDDLEALIIASQTIESQKQTAALYDIYD